MLKMYRPQKTDLWSTAPEDFDPTRNSREIERIERTWELIKKIPELEKKVIIDVGCGTGEIARRLKKLGATVHALEASQIPLRDLEKEGITTICESLPKTKLREGHYDLVICTDVIAYLPSNEHRLLMLELSRIVKKEGYVICSTPLDIYSEDALEIFESLLRTEFVIEEMVLSYHALHIRIKGTRLFRYNRRLLLFCEQLTKFFKQESGVSHAICLGKRKPLF